MAEEKEKQPDENVSDEQENIPDERPYEESEEVADPGNVVTPEAQPETGDDLDDEPESDELVSKPKEIPKRDADAPLVVSDITEAQPESSGQETDQDSENATIADAQHSKRKRLFIAATALVIVALVTFGAWLLIEYNSAERVFSDMLENQLNTETVTYDVGTEHETANFVLSATVDITDVNEPKTTGAFDIALNFGFLGSFDVQYNVVTVGDTLYMNFANFNVTSAISEEDAQEFQNPFEAVQGDWVQVSLSEAEEKLGERDFGATSFARGAIFGTGAFLTGNFDKDQRTTLLEIISRNDIYEVTASEEGIVSETSTYKYTVKLNRDGLKELYEKANEFYGLELDEADLEEYANSIGEDEITVWVSRDSRRITRLQFTEESTALTEGEQASETDNTIVVTVDFSAYNEPANIAAPTEDEIITIEEFEERVGTTF